MTWSVATEQLMAIFFFQLMASTHLSLNKTLKNSSDLLWVSLVHLILYKYLHLKLKNCNFKRK